MRFFSTGVGAAVATVVAGVCMLLAQPAIAAGAAGTAYCAGGVGRQDARKVPAGLVPAVAEAFKVGVDVVRADDAFLVRCVGPKLLACWVGANLDCGKAVTRRSLPGATAYCRENPGSKEIPAAATGHDTIYDWRCVGRRAVAGKIVAPVDAQGFVAGNWQQLR
jgi:hypothetical protein